MPENTTLAANAARIQLLKGGAGRKNLSSGLEKVMSSGQGIFNCYPNIGPLTGEDIGTKIVLEARTIVSQSANSRDTSKPSVSTGATLAIFRFIAPNEITETISHTWEAYESNASKVAEKIAAWSKIGEQALGVVSGIEDYFSAKTAGNFKDKMTTVAKALQGGEAVQQRIDMPLVYKDSEKRRYELTFQLGYYNNPLEEILAPVKALETLSCATLPNTPSITGVTPPCIFTITTEPESGLLYVKNAALMTVQPTYKGPFYKGLPTTCELHLTFQEVDPLWDTAFVDGGKSKVLVTETSTQKGYSNKTGMGEL